MIEIIITDKLKVKTRRTATLQLDGWYMIVDYPSGDRWFIKHAEQTGLNALARRMLVKPTAGITRLADLWKGDEPDVRKLPTL